LKDELDLLQLEYEVNTDVHPNVVSSYPAEEIFITKTWLSEGVYKDIFDLMEYQPRLKVNISDSNQSFTPLLTGNINWVASLHTAHFWHVFIRFPKTNTIYEWNQLVYTNDVARMSKDLETFILENEKDFYDNASADGNLLFTRLLEKHTYILRAADVKAQLPAFNLPYYEGLNKYNDKYWLGIYRRDELFDIHFLKDICSLSLQTKIGQLCTTPWKTLIIKGIEEKDKSFWNALLVKHQINMRHAANELNFQVEDHCLDGLRLKNYLVKHLNADDTRTFGLCIGIKTRKKSEVFSSILVKRRPLLKIAGVELFHVYDILCAKDYNPNERTGTVFSKNNPRLLLPEQLRRAIFYFGRNQNKNHRATADISFKKEVEQKHQIHWVYQCKHCLSIYDAAEGEPENGITKGTTFEDLSSGYTCPLCEAPKKDFIQIDKQILVLQAL
jgi:rubredoxin